MAFDEIVKIKICSKCHLSKTRDEMLEMVFVEVNWLSLIVIGKRDLCKMCSVQYGIESIGLNLHC